MNRDYEKFPDDDNGDVLWKLEQQGDNLSKSREIDFSVVFPNRNSALKFAILLLENELKVSFSAYEENKEMPWQVQAHKHMEPTHKNITDFESQLAEDSAQYNGRNDGWGCFAQDRLLLISACLQ